MKIGYGRVSTAEQSLDRQADELRAAGCDRVFQEVASGGRGGEPAGVAGLSRSSPRGDTLMVVELSRLGRNVGDLGRLIDDLDEKGASLRILNLGIDTDTAAGRLIYTIVGAVAAMERELLIERTQSGLAAARARGRVGGRRQSITSAQIGKAPRLYDERRLTVPEIAWVVGYSSATMYRYLRTDSSA